MSPLDEIKEKSKVEFRPAAVAALEQLRAIGAPEDALEFYRDSEPTKCAEIADVRLWPVVDILEENKDYVPGCFIQPHGYIVFATTIFGDAFCFDINATPSRVSTPIVLIAHDLNWDEMKREDIARLTKLIAAGFGEFLQKFVVETLDIDPLYPEHNWSSPDSEDMNRP